MVNWFQNAQPAIGVVGVNPPRHAQHAGNVHRPEGQDEANVQQPELPRASRSESMRPVTLGYQ